VTKDEISKKESKKKEETIKAEVKKEEPVKKVETEKKSKAENEKKLIQLEKELDSVESDLSEEEESMEEDDKSDSEDEFKVDWTRMFFKGVCPIDVKGMENLEPTKLSGEWYLHRTSEYLEPAMTPTCHHAMLKVHDDGTLNAIEEATFVGKTFVAENIKGLFTNNVIRADFFDEKLSLKMQVLDSDYTNYLIGY
jgi:hypothetical protein